MLACVLSVPESLPPVSASTPPPRHGGKGRCLAASGDEVSILAQVTAAKDSRYPHPWPRELRRISCRPVPRETDERRHPCLAALAVDPVGVEPR
jgi:hypothetical protein